MYIVKLNYIVLKYHITYHRTIKMKLVDDTSTYIDVIESNDKDPKFKVG